ncbi:glycoside hydrolase family 71 protein [Neolentinus lepideus HHB14362 ss-1]|uniref:Glycoside hydrolase family 71 protein n=1 Tax=Neolentinus lepideus HHB14362 ss-1 TaxID=1314782 RepID=A0A165VFM4_9AGAM|nr:glycoside hydrolase family 71 protein [Neolentinus lepideus HHB14362 ss-1]
MRLITSLGLPAFFTLSSALSIPFSDSSTHVKRQAATTTKYVVAHHIVGNTYPYTVSNWASDIALASAHGIDGFALNVGSDSWQPARVADAYTAAKNSGTGFKLFISFDMSVLPCSTAANAAALRTYITTYANHTNQLKYDGAVFASTFSGESCTFGQSSVALGWQTQFVQQLNGTNAVYFVPSFFIDPATFKNYNNSFNGQFNWNSGWPISLTTSVANSQLSASGTSLNNLSTAGQNILKSYIGSTATDTNYVTNLKAMPSNGESRAYMAAVSPWFFTHYSPQTYNKNFIYDGDWHLYPTRWQNLIAIRSQVDLVEIVTWNDYGESHYIGPIEGAQPNSQAWVNGFDHQGWLYMTQYFATAYKTGTYPAITKDQIFLWARPHTRNATSSDPVGKPTNYELDQDQLWAVVFTTAASTVTLSTSAKTNQTFSVPAGVSKLNMPLTVGGYMQGQIVRSGKTIVSLSPSGYSFTATPSSYNYNAFVAYST